MLLLSFDLIFFVYIRIRNRPPSIPVAQRANRWARIRLWP